MPEFMATHPSTLNTAAALIEKFEGIEEEAYLDPIGIPTICAGLTRYPHGAPVRMGDICDTRICRAHLIALLEKTYIPKMEGIPGWHRLGPSRQAVLLSFAWNLGADFYGAAGFETISRVLEEGAKVPEKYKNMAAALGLYVMAGGKKFEGLAIRRAKEAEIWNQEDDGVTTVVANQDTFLKKAPIDSKYLSAEGKKGFSKGDKLELTRADSIAADAHAWFTLKGAGERWAAYGPHWSPAVGTPAAVPEKVVWTDFGAKVSKYLTVGEVLQYDARRKPRPGSIEEKNILAIAKEFDAIREAWGGPLGVTSGHRPEPINAQVGGVPGSYHIKGMALDIYPVNDSLQKFHAWLAQRWSGGYGDGRNKGFIHIDTRNGGKFDKRAGVKPATIWTY